MACEHNTEIECTCGKEDCPRHGKCCDCVAYHREKKNVPVCLRF